MGKMFLYQGKSTDDLSARPEKVAEREHAVGSHYNVVNLEANIDKVET